MTRRTAEQKARQAAYIREYRITHRERIYAQTTAWRLAHREELNARCRAYYAAHREAQVARSIAIYRANPDRTIARNRLQRYHLTQEEYDAVLVAQGGVCADCGGLETRTFKGRVLALAIDHDHDCCPGQRTCGSCLRGIVCARCNSRRTAQDNARRRSA